MRGALSVQLAEFGVAPVTAQLRGELGVAPPGSPAMAARRPSGEPGSCAARNTRWTPAPRSCSARAVAMANAAPEE